jgi:hypothetical protein
VIITLDRTWLTPLATPSVSVQMLHPQTKTYTYSVPGEVRRYAGGRLRAVARAGAASGVSLVGSVSPSDLALIRSWVGTTVLFRDGLGTRWWGCFFDAPSVPTPDGKRAMVTLTLQQVTVSEAV